MARKPKANGNDADHGQNDLTDEDIANEILACAKAQAELDGERASARAAFSERHKKITGRLRVVGVSRAAFATEYENWYRKEFADDDEAAKKAAQEEIVYRDECAKVYAALNEGDQLDMLKIAKQATKARDALAKDAARAKNTELN